MNRRYSELEIETHGVTTVVSEWGSGDKVMLLVHGVSGNRFTWSDLAPRLVEAGYHVYAPDLRGCGDTIASGDQIGRTMQVYVDDLAAWTQALGLKRFALAGHSFGGRLAIDFAYEYPDAIEKLVLIAPAGPDSFRQAVADNPALLETTSSTRGRHDHFKDISGTTLEALHQLSQSNPGRPQTRSVVMRWLGNLQIDETGHARHVDTIDTMDAMMSALRKEGQVEKLASINAPAVVMRSIDEGALLRYTIPHYMDYLPNARYIDDVQADHSIPSTNPDAVFEALLM